MERIMDIYDIISKNRRRSLETNERRSREYLQEMIAYFADHDMEYINNQIKSIYGYDFNTLLDRVSCPVNAKVLQQLGHNTDTKTANIIKEMGYEAYLIAYMMPHLRQYIAKSTIQNVLRSRSGYIFNLRDYVQLIDFDKLDDMGKIIYLFQSNGFYDHTYFGRKKIDVDQIVKDNAAKINNVKILKYFDIDVMNKFRDILDKYNVGYDEKIFKSTKKGQLETFIKNIEASNGQVDQKDLREYARKNFIDIADLFKQDKEIIKAILGIKDIDIGDGNILNQLRLRKSILKNPTLNPKAAAVDGLEVTKDSIANNLIDIVNNLKTVNNANKYYTKFFQLGFFDVNDLYNNKEIFGKVLSQYDLIRSITPTMLNKKTKDRKTILDFLNEYGGYRSRQTIVSWLKGDLKERPDVIKWADDEKNMEKVEVIPPVPFFAKYHLKIKGRPVIQKDHYLQLVNEYLNSNLSPNVFCKLYNVSAYNPKVDAVTEFKNVLDQFKSENYELGNAINKKENMIRKNALTAINNTVANMRNYVVPVRKYIMSGARYDLFDTIRSIYLDSYDRKIFNKCLLKTLKNEFADLNTKDYDPTKVNSRILGFMLNDFVDRENSQYDFYKFFNDFLLSSYLQYDEVKKDEEKALEMKNTFTDICYELCKFLAKSKIKDEQIIERKDDKVYTVEPGDKKLVEDYMYIKDIYNCDYNYFNILRKVIVDREKYENFVKINKKKIIERDKEVNLKELPKYFETIRNSKIYNIENNILLKEPTKDTLD